MRNPTRVFKPADDHEAPGQIKFGEKDLEILFREYFPLLCGYCQVKYNFDHEASKEVVQNAFTKLWERRAMISPSLSVPAYLYKIVTNSCLDIIRHDKQKNRYENNFKKTAQSPAFTPDSNPAVVAELNGMIAGTIADMPEQMRQIFKLSRYELLKYIEIADTLGISVKTVETQMSRALQKLRKALTEYLPVCLVFFIN